MGSEIANEDYNLKVTNTLGGVTPGGSTSETLGSAKLNNKSVLIGTIGWTPSGCVGAGLSLSSGSSTGVVATSLYVKSDGQAVLRKGDVGVCAGILIVQAGGTIPCACNLEIDNAGQTEVKGE